MIVWEPGSDTITQHAACSVAIQQKNGLPDRPWLLTQLFNADSHSMVGSYIPACWATLRRWQEAQASKRSLVTEREFEWIEGALARITQQLRDKRRDLPARPDAYVRTHEKAIDALNHEIDKVQTTRDRLATLRHQRVSEKDVYGSLSTQPERLAENLPRWLAHAERRIVTVRVMVNDRSHPPRGNDQVRDELKDAICSCTRIRSCSALSNNCANNAGSSSI